MHRPLCRKLCQHWNPLAPVLPQSKKRSELPPEIFAAKSPTPHSKICGRSQDRSEPLTIRRGFQRKMNADETLIISALERLWCRAHYSPIGLFCICKKNHARCKITPSDVSAAWLEAGFHLSQAHCDNGYGAAVFFFPSDLARYFIAVACIRTINRTAAYFGI